MKRKIIYFLLVLLLINILIIIVIDNFLISYLSPDQSYKFSTLLKYLIPFDIISLTIFLAINLKKQIVGRLSSLLWKYTVYSKKLIPVVIGFLFSIYIFNAIFALINLDVSTDESTYISTYKNYYEQNLLMFSREDDIKTLPKDLLGQHLILFMIKPFTKFSVFVPRFITLIYSIAFVFIIFFYFKRREGVKYSIIALALLTSFPMFIYLSGSAFGENITMLFFFIAFVSYERYEKDKKIIFLFLFYFLIALSILTKLQFGIVFFPAYCLYIVTLIVNKEDFKKDFFHLIIIVSLTLLLFSLKLAFYKWEDVSFVVNDLFKASKTAGVNINQGFTNGFFRGIIKFFNNQSIFLFALAVTYSFFRYKDLSKLEKFLLLIVITNCLFYVYKSYTFRFGYFAFLSVVILSIKPLAKLTFNYGKPLNYFIAVFIVVQVLIGISENILLTYHGGSNSYQLYLNGDNWLKSGEKIIKDKSQKLFYSETKQILKNDDLVLFLGAESEMAAFVPNKFYNFKWQQRFDQIKQCDYFLVSAVYYQMAPTDSELIEFIALHSQKILKHGDYSLHRICHNK